MRFMQQNGKSFLRMNKFLEVVNKPNLGNRDLEKIETVKKMEGKLNRILANYEKSVDLELQKLKDFYKKVEDGLIEAVRRAMKRNYENSLEEFAGSIEKNRGRLKAIHTSCQSLTKLLNKGHVSDLSKLISDNGERNVPEIKSKINDIVDVMLNLDKMINEWMHRVDSLGSYPERLLRPKVDLLKLGGIFKQKELVVMEELENLYDLREREMNYDSREYKDSREFKKGRKRSRSPLRFDKYEDDLQDLFGMSKRHVEPSATERMEFGKNLDISKIQVNFCFENFCLG